MPGTSTIGDNKLRAESLPPEARTLNRHFRILQDPAVIRESILDVLDRAPPSCRQVAQIKQLFEVSFLRLKDFEHRQDRMFEQKLAKAFNAAIENAFIDADEDDMDSLMGSPVAKRPATRIDDSDSDESFVAPALRRSPGSSRTSSRHPTQSSKTAPPSSATKQDQASIALVSEADQASDESTSSQAPRSAKEFWGMLLEAMILQVASRTTRVWGRKKIYEVYRLNGTATTTKTTEDIRRAVHDEFGSMFNNGGDHRTYALKRESDGYVCIFLKIGKYYDYHDERNRAVSGEKKKKKADEFIVIVKPGSSLMAVTASRSASKAKDTKYLLPALDLGLSTVDKNVCRSVLYEPPARVGDYSGTEPMELLHAAQAAETGSATGRFATFASNDSNEDPLTEMNQVIASSVIDRTSEQSRLATSAAHGRDVAQAVARAPTAMTLIAPGGAVLDHMATITKERKRSRGSYFGEGGPQFKKVRFKWSGMSDAATKSWNLPVGKQKEIKMKCSVVFGGQDVFEGLREMYALGLMHKPVPEYLTEAPNLGTSTITIRDGAIVKADGPA